jgi:hypothetical protein
MIIISTVVSLILVNCQNKDYLITEPTPEEAVKIQTIGDTLSMKLLSKLKGELLKAISEGGAVEAIQVCNTKAIPLTEEIARLSNYPVEIKRTSSKYRNPKNAPDQMEKIALEYFENLSKTDKPLPDNYLQKVEEEEHISFRYYKPIKTGGLCLTCHGNPDNMDPELIKTVDELYPNDKAVGYHGGDFRGLVSITINEL